jgi:long-chain acyl-CoA synthetase
VSILCAAPFFHVYGMTVGMNLAVAAGGAMLLVPRWSAPEVISIIRKYRAELFPGVPTMYLALANEEETSRKRFGRRRESWSGSLHVCISGRTRQGRCCMWCEPQRDQMAHIG